MTNSLLEIGNPVKDEIDRITNSLVKIFTPRISTDINISAKAKLTAAIKLILDEKFLVIIDRLGYIVDNARRGASEIVNQILAGLSQLRSEIEAIVDKLLREFNPERIADVIQEKLIEPIFEKINQFEDDFFKDLNSLLDKIDTIFTGTVEDLRLDLVKVLNKFSIFDLIFALVDPCRDKLDIPKFDKVDELTDSDLYALTKCHLLERLQAEDKLENIKRVYGDIQQAAWKMTCVFRNAPHAKKDFFDDWIEYGQLIDLWRRFPENMTALDAAQEAVRKLEKARDEFLAKVAEIDLAQQTANNAVNLANNAQNTANDAVNKANNAQNTANSAVDLANQINSRTQKINFDGNKTILNSPLLITIPSASGFSIIPLEISVGTFSTPENLKNSFYILTKDVGSGKPFDQVIKPQ